MGYDRFPASENGYYSNGNGQSPDMGDLRDPRYAPMTAPADPRSGAPMVPASDPRYGAPSTRLSAPQPSQPRFSFDRQTAEYLAAHLTLDQVALLLRAYVQMTTDLHAGNQYIPAGAEQVQMIFFLQHQLLAMGTNGYLVTPLGLLVISTVMQMRLMAMR